MGLLEAHKANQSELYLSDFACGKKKKKKAVKYI